jgi:hypothetical protein
MGTLQIRRVVAQKGPIPTGGDHFFWGPDIQPGVTPTEALTWAVMHPQVVDPLMGSTVTFLHTLLTTIGEKKFDLLFGAKSLTPLNLHQVHPIWLRCEAIQEMQFKEGGGYLVEAFGAPLGWQLSPGFTSTYSVICNKGGDKAAATFVGLWDSTDALTIPEIFEKSLAHFRACHAKPSSVFFAPATQVEKTEAVDKLRRAMLNERSTPRRLSQFARRILPEGIERPFSVFCTGLFLDEDLLEAVVGAKTPKEAEAIILKRAASPQIGGEGRADEPPPQT